MARPRKFDEDAVLDQAMRLFWRRGYDGTSTADLLAVMGMTNSSLYKAFGSKESLFRRAAERYREGPLAFRLVALAEATPRQVVERVLMGTVELLTGTETPAGCLDVTSGRPMAEADASVRDLLVRNRAVLRGLLRKRLEEVAASEGRPGNAEPEDLAALVATLAHGLAVQAADGMTRNGLERIVKAFLATWQSTSELHHMATQTGD